MKPARASIKTGLRLANRQISDHLYRFLKEEDGVMVAFSLLMLLTMMVVGGIGIDIMRYEMDRARLQNTLDRAVLAAADLDQEQPAEFVVNDYFDKAGLAENLTAVDVQQSIGTRRVEAWAETGMNTFFSETDGVQNANSPRQRRRNGKRQRVGNLVGSGRIGFHEPQ